MRRTREPCLPLDSHDAARAHRSVQSRMAARDPCQPRPGSRSPRSEHVGYNGPDPVDDRKQATATSACAQGPLLAPRTRAPGVRPRGVAPQRWRRGGGIRQSAAARFPSQCSGDAATRPISPCAMWNRPIATRDLRAFAEADLSHRHAGDAEAIRPTRPVTPLLDYGLGEPRRSARQARIKGVGLD